MHYYLISDGQMIGGGLLSTYYLTAIDLVNQGKVQLKPLISKHFAFRDYLKAYKYIDENRETTMKVIINVQE